MSDTPRTPPFKAYEGDHPYLFVSYAHSDSNWVYPELAWLNDNGVKLWFDEGIETGAQWTEQIALHLENSAGVLFFATEQSVSSRNVSNELHFAVDSNKPVVIVSQDTQTLPASLKLILGQTQAIVRKDLSLASYKNKLLAATQIVVVEQTSDESTKSEIVREKTSIAVLPLKNNSPNEDDNYLAAGVTEELAYTLQRLHLFSVVAPESSLSFDATTEPLQAARDLNADFAITGGVRRSGERLRIDARLLSTHDGLQIWANRYDGDDADIFEFQDRIAIEIVAAIEPEILSEEAKRSLRIPTQDLAAWDLYLRGLSEFNKMTFEGYTAASEYWNSALDRDESFVQPVSGLAHIDLYFVLNHRGRFNNEEADQLRERGFELAKRAIQLDPEYPAGYSAMVGHLTNMNRYDEALESAKQALQLCPGSARVHHSLGFALFRAGKFDEALPQFENAIRLSPRDPDLPEIINHQAACHFFRGDPVSSLERANKSISLQHNYLWPHLFRILSLHHLGREQEAKQALSDFEAAIPDFSVDLLHDIDPELGKVFIDGLNAVGFQV